LGGWLGDSFGGRPRRFLASVAVLVALALVLAGCQSLPSPSDQPLGPRLDSSVRTLASPQSSVPRRVKAQSTYRDLVAAHLPRVLADAKTSALVPEGRSRAGLAAPGDYADIVPVLRPRATTPALHRAGVGLPVVARIAPGGKNAPKAGFQLPLTLVALPKADLRQCCDAALVDPDQIQTVITTHGQLAVAMDLEAAIDATRATGSGFGAGLANLLRPGAFAGRPRIVFAEPFDADKIPLVLVHGLMSTPRMWAPLVKALLADPEIRAQYQIWFFYYPTGQPVPLSALQLRDALDDVVRDHGPTRPMVLAGHSMGGILSRAQVSRITLEQAATILPDVASLSEASTVRRALVFEPRADVGRVVFLFTPHRGSRLASGGLGAWGVRLIRLPDTLIREFSDAFEQITMTFDGRLPTSIHGLSPRSGFLLALDRTHPAVPTHSIIGDRGRGTLERSSDGVVPYRSAHLRSAESEVIVPTGHGGFAHPDSIQELRRILHAQADLSSPSSFPPTGEVLTRRR
jgi:pimeloyl-ACP methyl ester carboxylesterase